MEKFSNIKIGDKVIVATLYACRWNYSLSKVSHVTKTMFRCEDIPNRLFYKADGSQRGGTAFNGRKYIQEYDEEWWQKHLAEEQAEKERHELIVSLQYISWSKLPTRQLQAIKTIIDESTDITSDQLNAIIAILHEEKE